MSFRIFILWLHLLGAVIWIGGLLFQLFVVHPGLTRATSVRERLRIGLSLEGRFRTVMWPAVGLVLLTGLYNVMNLLYATTTSGASLPLTFARILGGKLLLVALMIGLQAVQQFVVRPKRIALLSAVSPEALTLPPPLMTLQRVSQLLHRLTVALAVLILLLAMLLRG